MPESWNVLRMMASILSITASTLATFLSYCFLSWDFLSRSRATSDVFSLLATEFVEFHCTASPLISAVRVIALLLVYVCFEVTSSQRVILSESLMGLGNVGRTSTTHTVALWTFRRKQRPLQSVDSWTPRAFRCKQVNRELGRVKRLKTESRR